MKTLVTGGAGYIGSHAVRILAKAGHEPWVFDNLVLGHRGAVPAGRLIVGDLANRGQLVAALRDKQIEAVMHFAAFALVGESVSDPAKYYRNNVVGTLELLEAMLEAGVNKIVFSSTTATYGVPQQVPITERERQEPINPYGFCKLVIEHALADYARAYGFGYAALRYFNAAGAAPDGTLGEDHRPESHLIPLVLQVALGQRASITVFGDDYPTPDGTCVRDYVHVRDAAEAHVLALAALDKASCTYNVGYGNGYSVAEVVEMARQVTGRWISTEAAPHRAGDPAILIANADKLMLELGWQPRHSELDVILQSQWSVASGRIAHRGRLVNQ